MYSNAIKKHLKNYRGPEGCIYVLCSVLMPIFTPWTQLIYLKNMWNFITIHSINYNIGITCNWQINIALVCWKSIFNPCEPKGVMIPPCKKSTWLFHYWFVSHILWEKRWMDVETSSIEKKIKKYTCITKCADAYIKYIINLKNMWNFITI